MKEEEKINKQQLIKLLIYLFLGWFIFSVLGFLPKIVSIPIPEKVQKYYSIFYLTGNSQVNRVILNFDKIMVEPKAIEKMDMFKKHDKPFEYKEFELGTNSKFEARVSVGKRFYHKVDIEDDVCYNYFLNIPVEEIIAMQDDNIVISYGEPSESTGKRYIPVLEYKKIVEILNKNETEEISMRELLVIVAAVNNKLLTGWNAEEKTATFCNVLEGNAYVSTYKLGDEKKVNVSVTPVTEEGK